MGLKLRSLVLNHHILIKPCACVTLERCDHSFLAPGLLNDLCLFIHIKFSAQHYTCRNSSYTKMIASKCRAKHYSLRHASSYPNKAIFISVNYLTTSRKNQNEHRDAFCRNRGPPSALWYGSFIHQTVFIPELTVPLMAQCSSKQNLSGAEWEPGRSNVVCDSSIVQA